jgi:hypothetical protein
MALGLGIAIIRANLFTGPAIIVGPESVSGNTFSEL